MASDIRFLLAKWSSELDSPEGIAFLNLSFFFFSGLRFKLHFFDVYSHVKKKKKKSNLNTERISRTHPLPHFSRTSDYFPNVYVALLSPGTIIFYSQSPWKPSYKYQYIMKSKICIYIALDGDAEELRKCANDLPGSVHSQPSHQVA